jgi:hypothetical protein
LRSDLAHDGPINLVKTLNTIKARVGIHVLTWALAVGAGDGNRTRATSLGSVRISAVLGADLLGHVTAVDHRAGFWTDYFDHSPEAIADYERGKAATLAESVHL